MSEIEIPDVTKLTRSQVVPYYVALIVSKVSDDEIIQMNNAILSKWKPSGLLYIKDKAWKIVAGIQNYPLCS